MGKWKNAPVFYVIVQVRYNPILSLGTYLPGIQEHFRKAGFPDFQKRMNLTFNLSLIPNVSGGTEKAIPTVPLEQAESYIFTSADGSKSFSLEQNAISFHVTEYETFEWFSDQFLSGLGFINDLVGLSFCDRIGLRYLDAVLSKENPLSLYLIPEVLGLSDIQSGTLQHSFSETAYKTQTATVRSRVIYRDGLFALPPDLQGITVTLKPQFADFTGKHAIIDGDAFQETRSDVDNATVRETLKHLHEEVNVAFNQVVTKYALSQWK